MSLKPSCSISSVKSSRFGNRSRPGGLLYSNSRSSGMRNPRILVRISTQGRKIQRVATARPTAQFPDGKYPSKNDTANTQRTQSLWATGWSKDRNAIPRTATPNTNKIDESIVQTGSVRAGCYAPLENLQVHRARKREEQDPRPR